MSSAMVSAQLQKIHSNRDSLNDGRRMVFREDDPFAHEISEKWSEGLFQAIDMLPRFPWE